MTKLSIREFNLAGRGGDYILASCAGAFVGDGVALLKKDIFGDFAPLPRNRQGP
jgi:hypothetical protein